MLESAPAIERENAELRFGHPITSRAGKRVVGLTLLPDLKIAGNQRLTCVTTTIVTAFKSGVTAKLTIYHDRRRRARCSHP